MVKLYCAIVDVAANPFPVEIDESEIAESLKEAIRKTNPNECGRADTIEMQLFLAKTEDGMWLAADEAKGGVGDTTDFKSMSALPKLSFYGLSCEKLGQVHTEDQNGHVHVLVKLVQHTPRLAGPEVDVSSSDDLLAFLERDMKDCDAILSGTRLLDDESLQFPLAGREEAIEAASSCDRKIINRAENHTSGTIEIPVCCGISGMGKTRMLEEGRAILREHLKLKEQSISSVMVPYSGVFGPQPVEKLMPIEASFSWRLLYRFFLENNCSRSFCEWFRWRLPPTGGQLTLPTAFEVIERKLRRDAQDQASPLYLFLGVDEYQKIDQIEALRKNSEISVLHELVGAVGDFLCSQSSTRMIVLPIFAGTDWSVTQATSISSAVVTKQLPMPLLTKDQMSSVLRSDPSYTELLGYAQTCRHLLTLDARPWSQSTRHLKPRSRRYWRATRKRSMKLLVRSGRTSC